MANRRRRSRLGSQRRALPVRASICVQASNSQARATISHQTWFWAKPFSQGRFRSLVSFAFRTGEDCAIGKFPSTSLAMNKA
jgi:hypothetical protein